MDVMATRTGHGRDLAPVKQLKCGKIVDIGECKISLPPPSPPPPLPAFVMKYPFSPAPTRYARVCGEVGREERGNKYRTGDVGAEGNKSRCRGGGGGAPK